MTYQSASCCEGRSTEESGSVESKPEAIGLSTAKYGSSLFALVGAQEQTGALDPLTVCVMTPEEPDESMEYVLR
jgi:hypothetical protein